MITCRKATDGFSMHKPYEHIDPINFGYVMATGIISIAFYALKWPILSMIFLVLGSLGYVLLIGQFAIQFAKHKRKMTQEFSNIKELFKLMTFSAGTNSLAARFCFAGQDYIGGVLGIVGTVSTLFFIYSIFIRLFFQSKDTLQSISPIWLLLAISCHSVGIVITTLWEHKTITSELLLLIAFGFWTFGIIIYLMFMTLNIYRMLFLTFEGKDLNMAYWTWMGACAIAVFDGSKLVMTDPAPLFLQAVKPFVGGIVLLFWAWATAWIPILFSMLLCKYLYYKMPLRYEASLWALVFPLGMYTTSTFSLGWSHGLDFVQGIVPYFLWISVFTWVFSFALKARERIL